MPTDFAQEAGGVLSALPLERMFQTPAKAMADTQVMLSHQYYQFVKDVGLNEDGSVKMVTAKFDEPVLDAAGNLVRTVQREITVPLLSILTHPNVNVVEGSIDFELTIQSSSEQHSETQGEAQANITIGWGPFKASITARMSHKSSQTRKTDTRARYAVSMKIAKDDMPEGMHLFMETIRNAALQPYKAQQQAQPAGG